MRREPIRTVLCNAGEAEVRRSLETAGWRFTRQRAEVLAYLRTADCHPTAEQVYEAVRRRIPKISLATVYKALEALVSAQLASKVPDADGPARYDCRSEAHYHFRCLDSGEVYDLPTAFDPALVDHLDPTLVEQLRRQGFHVLGHRLELVGYFGDADSVTRERCP